MISRNTVFTDKKFNRVSKGMLVHLNKQHDPSVVWTKLRNASNKTIDKGVVALDNLMGFQWRHNETADQAGSRLLSLLADVIDSDQAFAEAEKAMALVAKRAFVCAIPLSVAYLKDVFSTDQEVTLEQMINRTRTALETMASSSRSDTTAKPLAMAARAGGSNRQKEDRCCFKCGRQGHLIKNCKRKDGGTSGADNSNQLRAKENANLAVASSDNTSNGCSGNTDGDSESSLRAAVAQAGNKASRSTDWIVDSGATRHMTWDKTLFETLSPVDTCIETANGRTRATGEGDARLRLVNGSRLSIRDALLVPDLNVNLLSVGQMHDRGIQTSTTDAGMVFQRNGRRAGMAVRRERQYLLETAPPEGALYSATAARPSAEPEAEKRLNLWHRRLGHPGRALMKDAASVINGVDCHVPRKGDICSVCMSCKSVRQVSRKRQHQVEESLGLIHMDISGPWTPITPRGEKYFVTVTDDATRFVWVMLLKRRSDLPDALAKWKAEAELRSGKRLLRVRADNAGEHVGHEMRNLLTGVSMEFSTPYTPEQNGVAERLNRSLMDVARCMIADQGVRKDLWGEAILHAAYLRNRMPVAGRKQSPEELWTGKKPDVSKVRVFGSRAWVHHPPGMPKLSPRAWEGVIVGHVGSSLYRVWNPVSRRVEMSPHVRVDETREKPAPEEIGIEGAEPTGTPHDASAPTITTDGASPGAGDGIPMRHGTRGDASPTVVSAAETVVETPAEETMGETAQETTEETSEETPEEPVGETTEDILERAAERSTSDVPMEESITVFQPPTRNSHTAEVVSDGPSRREPPSEETAEHSEPLPGAVWEEAEASEIQVGRPQPELRRSNREGKPPVRYEGALHAKSTVAHGIREPGTYQEAINDPDHRSQWKLAIEDELQKIKARGTWSMGPLPVGRKTVGCKWVFKAKTLPNGLVDRFKARLVAQGFSQLHGVDYHETYSPTVRYDSLRVLFALAAVEDLEIHQLDVVNAYLEADLSEEIYMRPPEGLSSRPGDVCRLHKALYGLKQSGMEWHRLLAGFLRDMGFRVLASDPAIMVRGNSPADDDWVAIPIYVDDLLIFSKSISMVKWIKEEIGKRFPITDLGEVKSILKIRVTRDRNMRTISLDQSQYCAEVLERYGMQDSAPVATPMEPGFRSNSNEEQTVDQKLYQQAIGSLNHLVQGTRPDLAYAVGRLGRHNCDPKASHWVGVKRVMRYLRATQGLGLLYSTSGGVVKPVGYSDSDFAGCDETRRSTGAYAFFVCGGLVTWKSKRQALVTLSTAEAEYVALSEAAKEAIWIKRLITELQGSCGGATLREDNQAAIRIAENPELHARTKHIDVRYHWIRDVIQSKEVKMEYCPTRDNVADALTKPLPRVGLQRLIPLLGLQEVMA